MTGEFLCLWDETTRVATEGEVCSYECYAFWINFHLRRDSDIIKVEEGQMMLLPLELHAFHKKVWENHSE